MQDNFNNIDIVFYHANCMDGLGSVAIFTKYFSPKEVIPVKHYEKLNIDYINKNILFLDFCYPKEYMIKLIKSNNIMIVDHHKTAIFMKELLPLNQQYIYMNKCATMLMWNIINPKIEPPIIVKYINDRDLWLNEMPDYQYVFDGMTMLNLTIESMQKLIFEDSQLDSIKHIGKIVNDNKMDNINFIKNNMYIRDYFFEGKKYKAGYINCPIYSSDIGSFLNENDNIDFVAIFYYNGKQTIFSLRGKDKIDLSKVAKHYNGGGHFNASGCSIDGLVDSLI